jgi:hypothetical protein
VLEDEEIENSMMLALLKSMFMIKKKDEIVLLFKEKNYYLLKNHGNYIFKLFKNLLSQSFF